MSAGAALQLAERTALEHGYVLKDYDPPEAHYQQLKKGEWLVLFRSQRPDMHVFVFVDDLTHATRIETPQP